MSWGKFIGTVGLFGAYDEGIKLLDDYNNALESLAKEKDMKIEY